MPVVSENSQYLLNMDIYLRFVTVLLVDQKLRNSVRSFV